jgi:hypothetical protein
MAEDLTSALTTLTEVTPHYQSAPAVRENVEPGTALYTDEMGGYPSW